MLRGNKSRTIGYKIMQEYSRVATLVAAHHYDCDRSLEQPRPGRDASCGAICTDVRLDLEFWWGKTLVASRHLPPAYTYADAMCALVGRFSSGARIQSRSELVCTWKKYLDYSLSSGRHPVNLLEVDCIRQDVLWQRWL